MKHKIALVIACFILATLACGITATPTPPGISLPATPTSTPRATAPSALNATPARPAWWPADLRMPDGAVLTSEGKAPAVWTASSQSADSIKDLLVQATGGAYRVYVITHSSGAIYDLLFAKSGVTYTLNITQGSDATILTGDRTGVLHLQMSGAINQTLDLPLRERLNLAPGSEISIGTAIPNDQCNECQYYINIHIAPFNGPGNYASKPTGVYIIDVELVPGGTEDHDDYRWAKQCSVKVQDALTGNFACNGLENVNDNTKLVDIAGNWQQPPAPQ